MFEREIPLHPVRDNRFNIPESLDVSPQQTPVIGIAVELTAEQLRESQNDCVIKGA